MKVGQTPAFAGYDYQEQEAVMQTVMRAAALLVTKHTKAASMELQTMLRVGQCGGVQGHQRGSASVGAVVDDEVGEGEVGEGEVGEEKGEEEEGGEEANWWSAAASMDPFHRERC